MTIRTLSRAVAAIVAGSMLGVALSAIAQPVHLPLDQETTTAGIGVACTGIGQTKSDPKWRAYPVLVEYAGPGGELLANATLMLSDAKGTAVLSVWCEGPWILLKLPPGKPFKVDGQVGRAATVTVSAKVKAPSYGQARVVLNFPGAG